MSCMVVPTLIRPSITAPIAADYISVIFGPDAQLALQCGQRVLVTHGRHHSYGQADRRRPRPLTPCGPDSKRSPAARCLRTVGALSASVLFPGLAEPPGGSESTRSFPRERHLPRARCFPNVGRAAMASARPTTRISTWGRRLWCFSTSFGQGSFGDRHEFQT